MIASVIVELGLKNINQPFTYEVPNYFQERLKVGMRVLVPFGHQQLEGFVIELKNERIDDQKTKPILEILDETPVLNEELLELGKYIADTTLSYLISAYQVMLPAALKAKTKTNISIKMEKYISYNGELKIELKMEKQKNVVSYVLEHGEVLKKELVEQFSSSIVKNLIDKGILIETEKEVYRSPVHLDIQNYPRLPLSPEQLSVYHSVIDQLGTSQPFLLHGVTGSGKTEVYLQIIESVLNEGKEAICLVPEISLTPQMVERFKGRFGERVALLHSGLSNTEKFDEWRRIERKEVSIVVGARSAIFAPFTNLGVIIMDEEHESTYKQDNNPKYHARDIALFRSKYHNCPFVMGSATPSMESYARAIKNVYQLLTLPNRINQQALPQVEIVDLKEEIQSGNKSILSSSLKSKIMDRISRGEQTVLLLNRRGYSSFITCRDCGYTHKCPHCDISLTYHKDSNTMKCHYCGYGDRLIKVCPSCSSVNLRDFGYGTQKIEEIITEEIPGANVLRMDTDTTSKKGAHENMLNDFKSGKYNLLLGTQMIAKGLDFPKITLVGVLNADTALHLPDFRSSEKTYQLLSQVAGRAGRKDLTGEVVIQTYNPEHYAIQFAKHHHYLGFFEKEMSLRKILDYPPYYNLVSILITSKNMRNLTIESNKISEFLKRNVGIDTEILGPSLSSIPKINDYYRYQCLIKYKRDSKLNDTLKQLLNHYKNNREILVEVDLNPSKIV